MARVRREPYLLASVLAATAEDCISLRQSGSCWLSWFDVGTDFVPKDLGDCLWRQSRSWRKIPAFGILALLNMVNLYSASRPISDFILRIPAHPQSDSPWSDSGWGWIDFSPFDKKRTSLTSLLTQHKFMLFHQGWVKKSISLRSGTSHYLLTVIETQLCRHFLVLSCGNVLPSNKASFLSLEKSIIV